MVRFIKVKITLVLIAVLLGIWNYFLRDKITIPLLSDFTQIKVWIIAGIILVVTIILNFMVRDKN